MKKLAILLFLFIFSISVFAQDKSLFTEDFSLIKHSGPNNRLFFEPETSSLGFGVVTARNRMQNWGDLNSLRYGKQTDINTEEESESLAEFYLKKTAGRSKKQRNIRGGGAILAGGLLIVLGASTQSEEDFLGLVQMMRVFSVIVGAAAVASGIYYLAVPSRAEREFNNVLSISDSAQRERASHEALSVLAVRGRRNRILTGILSAACSVGSLIMVAKESSEYHYSTYEYVYAAGYAALSVYSFVVKSPAERAFEDYLRERKREQRKEIKFRLGIMPQGGVKVGIVYSF
jgi:hypothetical protein